MTHTELKSLFSNLIKSVVDPRVKTTVKKYVVRFRRFLNWADKYKEITSTLPCTELHVGLYLQYLIGTVKHFSSVESGLIKWQAYQILGFPM